MKFTIRDIFWLTAIIGLSLAFWTERQRANSNFEVARNLQTTLDMLAEFAAKDQDWRITTEARHIEIRLPGENKQYSFSGSWGPTPGYGKPKLEPLNREWSRERILAEERKLLGPDPLLSNKHEPVGHE